MLAALANCRYAPEWFASLTNCRYAPDYALRAN
jgi:hypothetical protein